MAEWQNKTLSHLRNMALSKSLYTRNPVSKLFYPKPIPNPNSNPVTHAITLTLG